MSSPRDALTPDSLAMLQVIADTGSFAAAARSLGLVPHLPLEIRAAAAQAG